MLLCSGCKLKKPTSAFSVRSNRARGYTSQCKSCKAARRTPEAKLKALAASRLWHQQNPDKARTSTLRWRKANPEKNKRAKRNSMLRKYGLDADSFDALLRSQGGRCCICATRKPAGKGWAVDHNHATGRVRGILCSPCNAGIGLLQDDANILRSAALYLERT